MGGGGISQNIIKEKPFRNSVEILQRKLVNYLMKFLFKNWNSFLQFSRFFERNRDFRISKGRSPIRARVRTQAGGDKSQRIPPRQCSTKTRMARQQCDELEKAKRELLGTAQPLRRRRQASLSPRRDSEPEVR